MEVERVSDRDSDVWAIWIPLIGASILAVAVFIIYMNLDNELYTDTGLRLLEPLQLILVEIICFIVMFFILRSSVGKKTAKKAKVEND